jgi:hypothetical protein
MDFGSRFPHAVAMDHERVEILAGFPKAIRKSKP